MARKKKRNTNNVLMFAGIAGIGILGFGVIRNINSQHSFKINPSTGAITPPPTSYGGTFNFGIGAGSFANWLANPTGDRKPLTFGVRPTLPSYLTQAFAGDAKTKEIAPIQQGVDNQPVLYKTDVLVMPESRQGMNVYA